MFLLLVVDQMHEFELGVWRALFIHLLRMLESLDKTLINELDRRYAMNALMLKNRKPKSDYLPEVLDKYLFLVASGVSLPICRK